MGEKSSGRKPRARFVANQSNDELCQLKLSETLQSANQLSDSINRTDYCLVSRKSIWLLCGYVARSRLQTSTGQNRLITWCKPVSTTIVPIIKHYIWIWNSILIAEWECIENAQAGARGAASYMSEEHTDCQFRLNYVNDGKYTQWNMKHDIKTNSNLRPIWRWKCEVAATTMVMRRALPCGWLLLNCRMEVESLTDELSRVNCEVNQRLIGASW